MKKLVIGLVLVVAFCSFLLIKQKGTPNKNTSFSPGEELEYRVHLAFFTVGKARTIVDKNYHKVDSKTCYKVDAYGVTSDWISWISRFDDNWGAYVDTTSGNTHIAYRKLKEGSYRRDEVVTFDHEKNKAEVKVKDAETGKEDIKVYDIPPNTKDIVTGFLHLRVIDFSRISKGDTITLSGFLENASYKLKIIYQGKEVVHTRVGKIQCLRLRPIMPENSLFDGENSVLCWISDDLNRIPVKVQAKMFVGSAGLELIQFRGLRNQIRTVP